MNADLIRDMKKMKCAGLLAGVIAVVAALSYGYLLIHPTIGMDDTGIERYFVEGYAPHVGRWTLYVLNFIFDFAHFSPWFIDACGVILLCLAAYLFCLLWYRVSDEKVSSLSMVAFSSVFLTFPLIGEVYIFYLHNGIALSFFLMALAGLIWWDYLTNGKALKLLWMLLFVSLAIGCYESFALVYLVVLAGIYMLAILKENLAKRKLVTWLKDAALAIVVLAGSIAIRSIVCGIISALSDWPGNARGLDAVKMWFLNDPIIVLKDLVYQVLMRYFLNGEFIFGIKIFVITTIALLIAVVVFAVWKRKPGILPWAFMLLVSPWLFVPVELVPTPYRATQALMFMVAFGWLFCFETLLSISWKPLMRVIPLILGGLLFVVAFRQGFELNRYFYFDAVKSDYDEAYCRELALELERDYDLSKPVVFIGQRAMPKAYRDWVYLDINSEEYVQFIHQFNLIYTKALYKFVDNEKGYRIYDIAATDTVEWLSWAALADDECEIYPYMRMLGYSFVQPEPELRERLIDEALQMESYPVWPKDGAIVEYEDYICVYMGAVVFDL